MRTVVEYENLLPDQFSTRIEHCPLAYVPVGSLEWHGEHMAVGNDALKAEKLCELAAARCERARGGGC